MFSQRFKNFSASGNTQNYVPFQEYQNCEYKLKFLKKQLEFYLNNNKYTVAYNELDESIRRYLRKFFQKKDSLKLYQTLKQLSSHRSPMIEIQGCFKTFGTALHPTRR